MRERLAIIKEKAREERREILEGIIDSTSETLKSYVIDLLEKRRAYQPVYLKVDVFEEISQGWIIPDERVAVNYTLPIDEEEFAVIDTSVPERLEILGEILSRIEDDFHVEVEMEKEEFSISISIPQK